ncbi:MAG: hypothetical protein ABSD57_00450 [Verrucomicrobiota bacterium]
MNNRTTPPTLKTIPKQTGRARRTKLPPKIAAIILALAVTTLTVCLAVAQSTPPVLTIAPTGTNQLLITVTNGVGTASYELWSTPVLGNTTDYPWTVAAVGTNSQTSFILPIGPYSAGFYRAVLDTNGIPLWEIADPNNPSLGILAVTIDSPTNGAALQ